MKTMLSSAAVRFPFARSCINLEKYCDFRVFHCRKYGQKAPTEMSSAFKSLEGVDPDRFGTYSQPKHQYEFVEPDQMDREEEEKMEKRISRAYDHDVKCTMQIKSLIKQRKVSEALGILDNGEISKPDAYVYGLLIKACGSVGYTKKAFKLYNQMKKRGIKPRASVYTSLFNACSNSPWKEDTLARATYLLNSLEEVGYEPNDLNYNAMIKAFGRGGDLTRAFGLVDQMINKRIGLSSTTFAFILQACVSDREAGFRHAVIVWDKMVKNGISPTVYTYNLLLRCCKECSCGDGIEIKNLSNYNSIIKIAGGNSQEALAMRYDILTLPVKVIEESSSVSSSVHSEENEEILVDHNKINNHDSLLGRDSGGIEVKSNQKNINEVIAGTINNYLNPVSPQERFHALGGSVEFLKQMAMNGVQPNVKTFTQLLEVIPPTESAEKELILALEQSNLEKDVEFYNMLMKNRIWRFDYDGAKAVIPMMGAANLTPNIMTFGILAMGCKNKYETETFIANMKEAGFRLNAEIIGTLIHTACLRWDIFHVLELMELCIKEEIRPNARLMQHLQVFKDKIRNTLKEKRATDSVHKSNKGFQKCYKIYCLRLAGWLREIDFSEAQEEHPWTQYRRHYKKPESESSETNFE